MELLNDADIVEINKKVGEKGVVLNKANLEFVVYALSKNAPLEKKAGDCYTIS